MDIQCRYCQVELEANEEFYGTVCDCPGCGKEINIPDPDLLIQTPTAPEPSVTEPSDANPPPPPGTLMKEPCSFCGKEILTTSRRCPFCSKRLDEPEVVTKGGPVSRFMNIFKKK